MPVVVALSFASIPFLDCLDRAERKLLYIQPLIWARSSSGTSKILNKRGCNFSCSCKASKVSKACSNSVCGIRSWKKKLVRTYRVVLPSEQSSTSLGDSSCHAAAQSGRKSSISLKPPTTTFVCSTSKADFTYLLRSSALQHCSCLDHASANRLRGWNAKSLEEPHSSTLPSQHPSASHKPKQNKALHRYSFYLPYPSYLHLPNKNHLDR